MIGVLFLWCYVAYLYCHDMYMLAPGVVYTHTAVICGFFSSCVMIYTSDAVSWFLMLCCILTLL